MKRKSGPKPPGRLCVLLLFLALPILAAPGGRSEPGAKELEKTEEPYVSSGDIYHIVVKDAIHPISARFISRAVDDSEAAKAGLLIIQLQTPGGLMSSMDEIIEKILDANTRTPIAIWVAPAGARCASAGFFILLSSDIAIMAPGTHTGAAHPVFGMGGGGEDNEVMMRKVTHDASASIRSIAEKRGRDVALAERAVRESHSYTEEEALKGGLIDFVCPDLDAIVSVLDGKTFKKFSGERFTLKTEGAKIVTLDMTPKEKVLGILTNPTISYVLMMIGLLGLYVEITHPGLIFPGVVGGLCLLLAAYGLNLLPINYVGLLLILAALAMFIAEIKVASYGLLAAGGIIALVFGSLMLIDTDVPELKVSLGVIIPVALSVGLIMAFLVFLVVAGSRRKPTTGAEGLIGKEGVAVTDIAQDGKAFLHGEYWNAESARAIEKGSRIRVVQVDNLKVKVEPL